MFLSIVIPVWNDEKYLNECLDSCLDQQLSKDDYEIICVDDGSTDRTPEILREYAERYPNIRIITKQHGTQFGYGRVIGFEAAKGDYVWFVDHDDLVAAHAVDELKQAVAAHPDYERYMFPFYRFQNNLTEEEKAAIRTNRLKRIAGLSDNKTYLWNNLFKASALLEKSISPHSNQLNEAGLFWGMPLPFQIFGGDSAVINECIEKDLHSLQLTERPYYFYRLHAGQTISIADPAYAAYRAELRRNRVLYLGHRAWIQKQKYLDAYSKDPLVAEKAVSDCITRLRDLSDYASKFIEGKYWKEIRKCFRRKNVMFRRTPKAYPQTLRARLKQLSPGEKRNPRILLGTILHYYSFTYFGANLLYKLEGRKRRQEEKRVSQMANGHTGC